MLDEGNTIPFIARYRKERTGNLDEVELRAVRDRFEYLTELEDRRTTILTSIEEQGKLTDELKNEILKATTKQCAQRVCYLHAYTNSMYYLTATHTVFMCATKYKALRALVCYKLTEL